MSILIFHFALIDELLLHIRNCERNMTSVVSEIRQHWFECIDNLSTKLGISGTTCF